MKLWPGRHLVAAGALASSFTVACGLAWILWREAAANRVVAALNSGQDLAVAHGDMARAFAARGIFLISQGRLEEAQGIAERLEGDDPAARSALLYALGNAHMRHALSIFAQAPIREVAPIINQAKAEYRISLRLDPADWDARFNYDIAAALVRDQDPPLTKKGEEMARDRALVPDIPGVPNGLP